MGSMRPAPAPCTTRKAIRLSMFEARLHATEPTTNKPSATSHTRLPPKRPIAQPLIGMTMANASRKADITHCTVATEACMSRPMVATATLTMVRSKTGARMPTSRMAASLTNAGPRRSLSGWTVISRCSLGANRLGHVEKDPP